MLAACGLTVGLIFLNDGWGIASTVTVMLISVAGWLLLVRRQPG
jgi:hypothetical protein